METAKKLLWPILVISFVIYNGYPIFQVQIEYINHLNSASEIANSIEPQVEDQIEQAIQENEEQQHHFKMLVKNPAYLNILKDATELLEKENYTIEEFCAYPEAERLCNSESKLAMFKVFLENPKFLYEFIEKTLNMPGVSSELILEELTKQHDPLVQMKNQAQGMKSRVKEFFWLWIGRWTTLTIHLLILGLEAYVLIFDKFSRFTQSGMSFSIVLLYTIFDFKAMGIGQLPYDHTTLVNDEGTPTHDIYIVEISKGMVSSHLVLTIVILGYALYEYFATPTTPKKANLSKAQLKKLRNQAQVSRLHEYCTKGDLGKLKDVIRLYRHQIDINVKDKNGDMPLHLAISRQNVAIVKVITSEFEDDIDTSLRNKEDHDALDLAIMNHKIKTTSILASVISVANQASFSSLCLALKTDQDDICIRLIAKIPKPLFSDDPCLETDLLKFKKLFNQLKPQKSNNGNSYSEMGNLQIHKSILISRLEALARDKSETWKKEFSCPVCFEDMKPPLQIYACIQDHFICSDCLEIQKDNRCPMCRDDFTKNPASRRPLAEKWNM